MLGATRRTVLASFVATLASRPLAAQAQPQDGMRRLGVLMSSLAGEPEGRESAAALLQGLGELN